MLAERDALAVMLYQQFNRVAMPNLRLNQQDADNLLEFLQQETERQGTLKQAHAANDGAGSAQ
ncbi:hypothetical protein D3C72_2270880 [compost metagenome]